MYENDNYSMQMEYASEDGWESDDLGAEPGDDMISAAVSESDEKLEDTVSEETRGPLDVFRAADDLTRLAVVKEVFSRPEQQIFIDTYKEEEASQAELTEDEEWDEKQISGEDYFLLKYIENHPKVLEGREEDVAEALDVD